MSMIEWAKNELKLIGITDNVNEDDLDNRMNAHMYRHLIHMVEEFCEEGHSGFSASYAANILAKLFKREPLSPLTGKDDEWFFNDAGEHSSYWNIRNSRVFKNAKDGKAYYMDGIVFYNIIKDEETGEERKSYFTCRDSWVNIEFPYVPKTEYREWKEDNEN